MQLIPSGDGNDCYVHKSEPRTTVAPASASSSHRRPPLVHEMTAGACNSMGRMCVNPKFRTRYLLHTMIQCEENLEYSKE